MAIHTVGDSGGGETAQPDITKGQITASKKNGWPWNVKHHHIGAVLCFNFGIKKLDLVDISEFDLKNGDTLIWSFGEIDCRCHVYKHVNESTTYQSIIDKMIDNYFEAIKLNLNKLSIKLREVCVYNVVPPSRESDCPGIDTPYVGTDEERKLAYLYFNKILDKKCKENGYTFIDVYNKYVDEGGFLIRELSDGWVHIKDGKYLQEFLNKHNIT